MKTSRAAPGTRKPKLILFVTSSAFHLLPRLRDAEGIRVAVSERNKDGAFAFPDGERYVCLPPLAAGGRVALLHAGAPDPNGGLAELELSLAALKRAGMRELEIFFTYLPYAMQDHILRDGETNAAEDLLRKLFAYYGVRKIYAVEPHFSAAPWLSELPFFPVSAHELLLAAARSSFPDALFVAPDKGHERRTRVLQGVGKTRADSYTVALEHHERFMKTLAGKVVGVVDDIIETGGTLAKFRELCAPYKPKALFAVATHGVLPSGIARVSGLYGALFLSNTVSQPEATVDVSPLIIDALMRHAT
ncbi:MAG: hypothetical protein AAB699_00670 [Patescibacteria group bacterium]